MTGTCSPSDSPFADLALIARAAETLEGASPQQILIWALNTYRGSITLGTGFGLEGMALLDMAARIEPALDAFFLDTSFLFPETYELRRRAEARYGIEIRAVEPELTPERQAELHGAELWRHDPDRCCSIRKVEPLERAMAGYGAWITGIRRSQTATRAAARAVEWEPRFAIVKINPLIGWTRSEVWEYVLENRVPYNPLLDRGYPSIGCTHCTRPVAAGEDERAGRWSGFEKTECGLHRRQANERG